jgi:hypothetical protein
MTTPTRLIITDRCNAQCASNPDNLPAPFHGTGPGSLHSLFEEGIGRNAILKRLEAANVGSPRSRSLSRHSTHHLMRADHLKQRTPTPKSDLAPDADTFDLAGGVDQLIERSIREAVVGGRSLNPEATLKFMEWRNRTQGAKDIYEMICDLIYPEGADAAKHAAMIAFPQEAQDAHARVVAATQEPANQWILDYHEELSAPSLADFEAWLAVERAGALAFEKFSEENRAAKHPRDEPDRGLSGYVNPATTEGQYASPESRDAILSADEQAGDDVEDED